MSIRKYLEEAISTGKEVTIEYVKYDGEISTRKISELEFSDEFGDEYITAFCHMRGERRTFKISRIRTVDGVSSVSREVLPLRTKSAYRPNSPIRTINRTSENESHNSIQCKHQPISTVNNRLHNVQTGSNNKDNRTIERKSEGCYIATMAYGYYDHPQVVILRRYRDNVLMQSVLGRVFVKFYYWISPKMVKTLRGNNTINSIIRKCLDRFIIHLNFSDK
jgi:hypothetical protein